jgi:O-antigen/teichoic acid export membrane protein
VKKGAFALAPLQIAQALIGFGAIAAFTRLMSAEDFGRYALALSISMLAHTLVFTWAEAAAYRFFASARAERRLRDHFATLAALALALGIVALALTAALLFVFGATTDLIAISAFAAGAAVLRFFTRLMRETERAAMASARFAAAEAAYLAIGFAAGIAVLITLDLGAAAPFAGLAIAGCVVFMLDAPRILKRARGGAVSIDRVGAYAGYGAPLALAIALDLGVQTASRFLIANQAGAAELGGYAAAFGLARPLDLIFMWAGTALAPVILTAFESKGVEAARDAARSAFCTIAALALPCAAGLMLTAGPLAELLVGPALSATAAHVLPWLTLAALVSGFNLYYWSETFQLTHRTGLRALLMLAPGALQIALTMLLVQTHGAVGGAAAAALGAIAGGVLLSVVGRNFLALPFPTAPIARTLAATSLMAGVVSLIPLEHGIAALAAKSIAGVFAYAIGAFIFDVGPARAMASAVWQSIRVRVRLNSSPAAMDQT